MTLQERILNLSMPEPNSGCWLWLGATGNQGYGHISIDGRTIFAHRVSYAAFVGEIPAAMQLDHLCSCKACVNPAHLEPVTASENQQRSMRRLMQRGERQLIEFCKHGHVLDGIRTRKGGGRYCKTCGTLNKRRSRVALTAGNRPASSLTSTAAAANPHDRASAGSAVLNAAERRESKAHDPQQPFFKKLDLNFRTHEGAPERFQRWLQHFVPSIPLPDSAASHGVVDIPDSGPDTLNQFSDRFPVPNRCPDCGTHWTDTADCPRFRCPMLDYFQREPSNMRAAVVHRPKQNTRGDGPSWQNICEAAACAI